MSGALTAVFGTAMTFGGPALEASGLLPAWIRQGRKIGTIIPDVTIEEQHSDRLTVTQHPVAINSPISDHAYRMPATVTMRCGWSNANPIGALVQGGLSGLWSSFTETRARNIYDQLRALQGTPGSGGSVDSMGSSPLSAAQQELRSLTARFNTGGSGTGSVPQLVDITTGKRDYKNMALVELSVTTDHTKEYSLFVEAHFQEVFIVRTRTTTQPASTEMMGNGSKTAATQDAPAAQPAPTQQKTIFATGLGGTASNPDVPPLMTPHWIANGRL